MQKAKIAILISSILIIVVSIVACDSPPVDEKLIQVFHKNQEDFDKIVKMLERDANIEDIEMRSVEYEDNSGPKISNKRMKKYRDLITKLRIRNGIYRGHDGGIYFNVYSQSGVLSGSEKGYVFSAKKYELVESLDVLENSSEFEGVRYRELKGNWYLIYSKW